MTPAEQREARRSRLSALRRIIRVERLLSVHADVFVADETPTLAEVEARVTDVESRVDSLVAEYDAAQQMMAKP